MCGGALMSSNNVHAHACHIQANPRPCRLAPHLHAPAGYLLGSFSMDPAGQGGSNPQVSAQLAALQKGGPWGQARNLGVFTGANAGLSLAIKKGRGGKEDVWGS